MSFAVANPIALVAAVAVAIALLLVLRRRFPVLQIHRSKRHLQSAFDAFSDPLAVVSRDYRIVRANRAYADFVKREYAQLLDKCCHEVLRNRQTPCEDCSMRQTLDGDCRTVVERSPHPHGAANAAVSLMFYPFPTSRSGAITSVVEQVRDITPLEQAKAELEQKHAALELTASKLRTAQAAIRDEIDLARTVQQGLLPRDIPQVDGLRITVAYRPIQAVGGDIYDFVRFSPTRLGIFIGDASGHGMPAALVGTLSKMSLYHHTQTQDGPGVLLSRMNTDLVRNFPAGQFLTCFWTIYDSTTMTMRFARAGHPRPMVQRSTGETVELQSSGTFLGIVGNLEFEEQTFQCRDGDRFFLYTDGVFMVSMEEGSKKSALSSDRLRCIFESFRGLPIEEVIPAIQNSLSPLMCEDDYTLIIIDVVKRTT